MKKSDQQDTKWQKHIGHIGVDRSKKVGMEIKVLPKVREQFNALAIARGIAPQRYVERLIVDEINGNIDLVTQGRGYLEQANGNFRQALALAQDDKLIHAEAKQFISRTDRPR